VERVEAASLQWLLYCYDTTILYGGGLHSMIKVSRRLETPCMWLMFRTIPDIREFTTKSWRDVIGLVPQDPIMFTGTIASNIAYGNGTASRREIEAAALEANCDFVWGMPQGFDTPSKGCTVFVGSTQTSLSSW
jgi:hypothetical protein